MRPRAHPVHPQNPQSPPNSQRRSDRWHPLHAPHRTLPASRAPTPDAVARSCSTSRQLQTPACPRCQTATPRGIYALLKTWKGTTEARTRRYRCETSRMNPQTSGAGDSPPVSRIRPRSPPPSAHIFVLKSPTTGSPGGPMRMTTSWWFFHPRKYSYLFTDRHRR